jgi:metal-responsive CopG/Arc/MetJ family transcriptional regulator
MRKKIPLEEKKKSTSVKINSELIELFDKYVDKNNIKNKSKFIEELITNELKNKKD